MTTKQTYLPIYNFLRRMFERGSNFKMQVFIFIYEEEHVRIFLFYFNKICNRFKFITRFSSFTLHAVNILLWKKIFSLTFSKVITASRPATLIRVFLMVRSRCITKGERVRTLPTSPKVLTSPFCWNCSHQKIEYLHPSPDHRPYVEKKKCIFICFRQIWPKSCLWHEFLVTQSWLIWKSSTEL